MLWLAWDSLCVYVNIETMFCGSMNTSDKNRKMMNYHELTTSVFLVFVSVSIFYCGIRLFPGSILNLISFFWAHFILQFGHFQFQYIVNGTRKTAFRFQKFSLIHERYFSYFLIDDLYGDFTKSICDKLNQFFNRLRRFINTTHHIKFDS